MTPTASRAFACVARLGSVKAAAGELDVSEAAVSMHVGQLRKEFDDLLFTRTSAGLAFTPGGLRLASRAVEILGLQDRTVREVTQAGHGLRVLRVASSTLFAEHAAPGLIDLFASRADDLEVELSVHSAAEFPALLATRTVDVAIGPAPSTPIESMALLPFLLYDVQAVAGPEHPLTGRHADHRAGPAPELEPRPVRGRDRRRRTRDGEAAGHPRAAAADLPEPCGRPGGDHPGQRGGARRRVLGRGRPRPRGAW